MRLGFWVTKRQSFLVRCMKNLIALHGYVFLRTSKEVLNANSQATKQQRAWPWENVMCQSADSVLEQSPLEPFFEERKGSWGKLFRPLPPQVYSLFRLWTIRKVTYLSLFPCYYLSQRGRKVLDTNIYCPLNMQQSHTQVSYHLMISFNATSEVCICVCTCAHTHVFPRAHAHTCVQHPPDFLNSIFSKRNYKNVCGT